MTLTIKESKDEEKSELTAKGMTYAVINVMTLGGTNPLKRSIFTLILGYTYVIVIASVVILMGFHFYHTKQDSIGAIVKDLIIFIGFIQIIFKQLTAIQRHDTLLDMLQAAWRDFWPLSKADDEKMKQSILNTYKKTNILTRIYGYGAMFAVYSIVFQSLLKKDALVLEIWIPHEEILRVTPYYQILFAIQTVIITLGVYVCVVQLDKLFIVMIALVYVQFRMIKVKLLNVGKLGSSSENYGLMRECVIHHNKLLSFVARFETVYSRLFLPTVASNIFIATVSMWGLMTESNLSNRLITIFVYFTVMSQVLSYCIAGQIIQDVAMTLGRAAYECDWTGVHDYKIRMGLIMIMTQASRKVELTVGGFMILCMESFGALIRASFSFLAFIVNTQT